MKKGFAKTVLTSGLLTVLGSMLALAAVTPGDFEYRAPINPFTATEGDLVRVTLPQAVLRHTATDSSDLRLFDDQQREIPYVAYPATGASLSRDYFGMKVLGYRDILRGCEVIVERPEKRTSFDGIAITTANRDFQKFVTVESSSDRSTWKVIQRDTLFDFSSRIDLRQNEIRLPNVTDRYLRLTILDQTDSATRPVATDLQVRYQGLDLRLQGTGPKQPFRIEEVRAWYGENEKREAVVEHSVMTSPKVEIDAEKNSVVALHVGNLPLSAITLTTEGKPYYYRRVEVRSWSNRTGKFDTLVASGWIYHLPGMARPETRIGLNGSSGTPLQLKIINGDNTPLVLASIDWQWPRADLYFFPQTKHQYQLFFGATDMPRPDYDLSRIIPRPDSENPNQTILTAERATVGATENNPDRRVESLFASERSQRLILIAVILVFGAGLAYWAYSILRKTGFPSSPQR